MKRQILIYNNSIKKDIINTFSRKQYFAIPVIPIKVALKYDTMPTFNHFERAILTLLLSGKHYTILEISEILMLDDELVELIIDNLTCKEYLDKSRHVTEKAENILKGIYKESTVVVKYAFYDLNRDKLLNATIDPNMLNFSQFYFKEYKDYSSNDLDDYNNHLKIISETNNFLIKFPTIDFNYENKIDNKKIESSLNKEKLNKIDEEEKVLISATVIEISNIKHYLLSYVETSINSANTNRWIVKNPLNLNGDLDLQNFFYFSNSNKIIQLIIESLMKIRTTALNDKVDKTKIYDFVKNKLFNKPILEKHNLFIEPLAYVLDGLSINNENISGQSGNLQLQETIKMAMIYFGQLFENLLYQAAIEYEKCDLQSFINLLNKSKDYNINLLTEMAYSIGFNIGNQILKIFSITKNDLVKMFQIGKEYILTACISMNILIGNRDDNYFMNKLVLKDKDFILKLEKLKSIRDSKRHTTDNCNVTIKDYLDLVFDVLELAFGYKLNQNVFDEYMSTKVTIYDYSYSHEYIRNKIGTSFFESNDLSIVKIKNHLIEMHKKYIEKQSDYIASAHSIIEDIYKLILNNIISNNKIDTTFTLKDYFATSKDFQDYVEMLGFDVDIDQSLFATSLHKALVIDSIKTENFIKIGLENNFEKSTNRVKMQSLILLFKINNHLVNDFLINQYRLKNIFKLTTIIMFLDSGHKQNNYFNDAQATYVVDELVEFIKNVYNNGKIIDWRKC